MRFQKELIMFVEFSYKPLLEDYNKDKTVKLSTIVKLLENAGNSHSDRAGDGVLDAVKNQKVWVLTDWKVKMMEEARYGQLIKIVTWSQTVNQIFNVARDFEIYADDKLIGIATTRWVILDLQTGRPCKIEPSLIEKYEPEEKTVFEEKKLDKIPPAETVTSEIKFYTRKSDFDFNGHVHNLTYIDYAFEALPQEIADKNFHSLRITYKAPITADCEITASYTNLGPQHLVTINTDRLNTQILFEE